MEHISNQQINLEKVRQDAATLFLAKTFNWMGIGLAITGVVAWLLASSGIAAQFAKSQLLFFILFIGQLGLVFYLSARIEKLRADTATWLFIGYSALTGVTMSLIFLVYTSVSIATTFFITAGMFIAMSIYGFVTKRDLSGLGSFLFMGLIGIIIASFVNFFLKSPALHWAISFIGVFIFVGLTAYDVQRIKRMGEEGIMERGEEAIRKGAIIGALALYLDFINLFLMLLQFFGGSRD